MFSLFNNTDRKSYTEGVSNNDDNFSTLQSARQDLVGEINAIIEYDNHIHNTTNPLAKKVWEGIKNEELAHVGELLALLNYLQPSQREFVEKGIKEVNDMMKN